MTSINSNDPTNQKDADSSKANYVKSNHNNDDDDDDIPIEEHHELVINQSMSIGTDESDDNNNNHYYSSNDDHDSIPTSSYLFSKNLWRSHNTKYKHRQQHEYNFLDSVDGIFHNTNEDDDEDDDDDDDNDTDDFIQRGNIRYNHTTSHNNSNNTSTDILVLPSMKIRIIFLLFIVISIMFILVPNSEQQQQQQQHSFDGKDATNNKPITRKYKGAPQYICPSSIVSSTTLSSSSSSSSTSSTLGAASQSFSIHNDNNMIYDDNIFPDYRNNSIFMNQMVQNLTWYIDNFRTMEYMDYNYTYNTVKDHMKTFKLNKYAPNIKKSGATILDIGCGIGLNLLMTYEILQEYDDIRDVHLYGTDYSTIAANMANILLDNILQEAIYVSGGKRGVICNADPIHLSFIPDNSFDLVYTSRIVPIQHIWDQQVYDTTYNNTLQPSINTNASISHYQDICQHMRTDWKSATLYQLEQDQQEIWYGQWIMEMIRIVKPGMIIGIEHIIDPYCNETYPIYTSDSKWSTGSSSSSGGGVRRSFWDTAVQRFHWDVDPSSIEIEQDTLFSNQYHVIMKKQRRSLHRTFL